MKLAQALRRVLNAQPELAYGFVAAAAGELLCDAGRKGQLADTDVIDTVARPESVRAFIEAIRAYEKEDPRLVPRLYSQGRTYGVIGEPAPGFLLAVFGAMPVSVYSCAPLDRAQWIWGFRERTWAAVTAAWSVSGES